jgi:hypothetical protein
MGIKQDFETDLIALLGLPKGVIWFTLFCHFNKSPVVNCTYEVQTKDGNPKIGEDGNIETMKKRYKIVLEEEDE